MTGSNTANNSRNATGKPFVKGDPRINRKGRPKSFDAVRELAQSISHEVAKSGEQPVVTEGHVVTVAEAILRQWASSKNPQLQKAFIELAFGKVPDKTEVTGKDGEAQKVIVEYVNTPYPVTGTSSGTSRDTSKAK